MGTTWELELIAPSLSIGSHLELDIRRPEAPIYIGEEWELELSASIPEGLAVPVLRAKDEKGLSLTVKTILPDGEDDTTAIYKIPISIHDPSGEGELRILIKGGEFFATLGMGTVTLNVLPQRVRISLLDLPYTSDGTGEVPLRIALTSPGDERIKGTLQVEAFDDGGKVRTTVKQKVKPSFKGKGEFLVPLLVHREKSGGNIDIKVTFRSGGSSFEVLEEDAITIEDQQNISVKMPSVVEKGSSLKFTIQGSIGTTIPEVSIGSEGEWTQLNLHDSEDGSYEYDLPEDLEGSLEVKVHGEDGELFHGDLLIERGRGVRIINGFCSPGTTMPGSSVLIGLSYRMEEKGEDITAVITLGGRKTIQVRLPLESIEGSVEKEIDIPGEWREGQHPMEVSIERGGERVARELFPRALILRSDSSLIFEMATPLDLHDGKRDELTRYLLPEERVDSTERTGDLEVIELSTGRKIYRWQGSIVHGRGWTDEGGPNLISAAFAHFLLRLLRNNRSLKRMGEMVDQAGSGLYRFGSKDPIKASRPDDGYLDNIKRSKKKGNKGGDGTFTGSVLNGSADGDLFGYSGSHKDIKDLSNAISNLMSGEMKKPLKEVLEKRIKRMKGARVDVGRGPLEQSLKVTLSGMRSSLSYLRDLSGEDADINDIGGRMGALIYHISASSLIRIEMLSSWTNEAMGSWDDLRVQRQRYLKKEINRLLEFASLLDRLFTTVQERLKAYDTNMVLRNSLERISHLEIVPQAKGIHGSGGKIWKGRITLRSKQGEGVHGSGWIHLPSSDWHLLSPKGEQEGRGYAIGPIHIPRDGSIDIDLECRAPSSPEPSSKGLLFMTANTIHLEVEP